MSQLDITSWIYLSWILGAAAANTRYTTLKNLARRLVWRDKRAHWDARARTLEDACRDHNLHDAYKHLKTLGVDKEVPVTTLKDLEGNVLTAPEAVHVAWKEFFEVLLNCRRDIQEGVYEDLPVCPADSDFMVEMPPSRLEVSWGLQAVLHYKSAEICGIKGEMLKRGGTNLVTLLHQLITAIWETGHMPDQWREGIIAPIWKAGDEEMCKIIEEFAFRVSLQRCTPTSSRLGFGDGWRALYLKSNMVSATAGAVLTLFSYCVG
jgi:hypothetical protein